MLNKPKQNRNKEAKLFVYDTFENSELFSLAFSVPYSNLRASLKKIGERQCLKWYVLLYSICFTEVLFPGLCHLQMSLYLLSRGNSSPFGSRFVFSIFKIWWSGIIAHFFHFSPQTAVWDLFIYMFIGWSSFLLSISALIRAPNIWVLISMLAPYSAEVEGALWSGTCWQGAILVRHPRV